MAKQGSIKHYRQTGSAKAPPALPFGELAVAKDGTLFVGNEANVPVQQLSADSANGYTYLSDGTLIQYGTASVWGSDFYITGDTWFKGFLINIPFTKPFAAPPVVVCTGQAAPGGSMMLNAVLSATAHAITNATLTVTGNVAGIHVITWIAIGRGA